MSRLSDPHHDPSERWVSDPAPALGDTVVVSVDVPSASGFDRVALRYVHDGEATWLSGRSEPTRGGAIWRFELPCCNPVVNYRFWLDGGPGARWLNGVGVVDHDPTDQHDFRLLTTGSTPSWVPATVWYQIFPDRFASSGAHELPSWAWTSAWDDPVATGPQAMTQIYGGDLDGIVERLDHLTTLGVGGIYLTPVFPARSNHRYDATTFDRVDPLLGGDAALARLSDACHRAGLRIITDLTLNHTGDHHDWFLAAQADEHAEEAGYYCFTRHPDRYESWMGVRSLPKLDHGSVPLRRRLYEGADSVLARFLRPPFSMDGWRIDVANMTGRSGANDHNELVRNASRRTIDAVDPDRWLVAEHSFDASRDLDGRGWHGVMNYAGVARPIASWLGAPEALAAMMPGPGQDARGGRAVAATIDTMRASMPWQCVLGSMSLLGSHDTARWRSIARSGDLADVGVGLLLGLPGAPCLFAGDEVGVTAPDNERSRRPMPWDRRRWDLDVYEWYRTLIRARIDSSALSRGGFRWVECEDESLAFVRSSADEEVVVRATRRAAPALDAPELAGLERDVIVGPGIDAPVDGPSITFVRIR